MHIKTCRECGSQDPETGWVAKGNICKGCQRKVMRQHYADNKQAYLDKADRNREIYRTKMREFIREYLVEHPCVDCGESDLRVLEFDHVDPANKNFTIGAAIGNSQLGFVKIKAEIEKCEVRCANCHRKRTSDQFKWWRATYAPIA